MASLATLQYHQPSPQPSSEPQSAAASFSALEWSVVDTARAHSLSSLRPAGSLTNRIGSLLGISRPARLADRRLEVLRRTAVCAWHQGHVIPTSQLREFLSAGFTLDQYELLQNRIGQERPRKRGLPQ
jgi:hypothetical protein